MDAAVGTVVLWLSTVPLAGLPDDQEWLFGGSVIQCSESAEACERVGAPAWARSLELPTCEVLRSASGGLLPPAIDDAGQSYRCLWRVR